jgi:D-xylose 1-dehydrogenase (NADP+, D-xylono-1,5-lactone-forming)
VLRWGLLGTARINRLLIPAIRASARSSLAAVASRDRQRACAYAAEWKIPGATSYEALVADSSLDIIYIPLPNSLHAPWTIRAVEAGRHVLCEKPLAIDVHDVDAIAAAAARHRRIVTEGFMYRHTAQTARLLDLLRGGSVGEVRTIESAFTFLQTRTPDVRLDRALGGGCLWDIGCYPVSLAQLIARADPVDVSGSASIGATGVDERFTGRIVYANGIVCGFDCGFRAEYHTFLRVGGSEGTLTVERPFRPEPVERLRLEREGRVEEIAVHGNPVFADEVADMEDAALGLRPPRVTLGESRRNVATIVRLHEAARA